MSINLFDANFYRATNSDLRRLNDAQAWSHFQNHGLNEGRAFSPFVNLNFYRSSNSDLGNLSNRQAFNHLQNNGVREGRRFCEFIDLNFYRASNRDLARLNNEQLFAHLRSNGVPEGRRFSPLVDLNFYRASNSDLARSNNKQLFEHLQNYGVAEGRRFSPFVDLNFYRVANPDLTAASVDNKQLLEHLAGYGVADGRRFSIAFDSNYYRNANSDLARLNNTQLLEHFQRNGLGEGRASSESFDVRYYLANNSDLRAKRFNNQQAHQHFEMTGFQEGRLAAPLPDAPTEIGNTLDTAFSLDVLRGNRSVTQFVGTTDRDDYYRFTLASTSNFNLSLNGLSDSAYAELIFDSNGNNVYDDGERLYSGYGSSYSSGEINETLGAGTYFIRVYTYYDSDNTNYTLGVSATATTPPTTPRDPGNTLGTAFNIGPVSGNRSVREFVGSADRDDYYRFTLASTSNLNLSLNSLSDYAELEIIFDSNGNGQVDYNETLGNGYGDSNDNASISSPLGAGTYFIRVNAYYGSTNTNYTLEVSATATLGTTPTDPGSTLGTAFNIGIVSGSRTSVREFVGSVDHDDYYRFTLASTRSLNLSLSGLSDSAYAELIFDSNGNGVYDYDESLYSTSGSSSNSGTINRTLGAGNYFIRVYTSEYSSYNTNYTLSLFAV